MSNTIRFETLLSSENEDIEQYLQKVGISVDSSSPVNNLYRITKFLGELGKLDPEQTGLLKEGRMWRYLLLEKDLIKAYNTWSQMKASRNVILYVDPEVEDYISTIRSKLIYLGVRIIVSSIPERNSNSDVFFLTEGIYKIEKSIENYGDFCVIIGIDNIFLEEGPEKNTITSENYTVTCYSPLWLFQYLTTPVDPNGAKLTYMVSGFSGIRGGHLHMLMRDWRLVYNPSGFVDYLSHNTTGTRRDKKLDNLPAGMKNVTNNKNIKDILDKSLLYSTLTKIDPGQRFVLPSKNLEPTDTFESLNMGDVLIVRPVGTRAFQGRGIKVVTNDQQLQDAFLSISKNPDWTHSTVSPYIRDPMLHNGKKMHLRQLLLVTTWGVDYVYPIADGSVAKLPYIDGDYDNADIHDTHLSSTDVYFVFPESFSDKPPEVVQRMRREIDQIGELLSKAIKGKVRAYSECSYGYDPLGLDIMFREDGSAILIEANTNAGFHVIFNREDPQGYFKWYEDLNQWIYDRTIKKYIESIDILSLIPISDTSVEVLKKLSEITTNPEIMRWIGRGETWDYDKLLSMSIESKNDLNKGEYLDWVVTATDKVIGYVSLRPYKEFLQIRVLISEKRKGYGLRAVNQAVSLYRSQYGNKKIYALVKSNNIGSLNLFKKLNWKEHPRIREFGSEHNVFST